MKSSTLRALALITVMNAADWVAGHVSTLAGRCEELAGQADEEVLRDYFKKVEGW